jgi:hypothetical protein
MGAERYLRFDVRRPHGGRPILWPVRVLSVLYPTKRDMKLNLFKQAILGLARARCKDRLEMAELLGLDQELIAFIIATQLIPDGLMTDAWAITLKGERALEEDQDANEEFRMGYAYQDAISGNLLPRFTEELSEIEFKRIDENGYPIFLRDKDSGKEDTPFRLSHLRENTLDIGALFEALKRNRVDRHHAKQRNDEILTSDRIDSLSFVESTAQPMWLWTWIFPDETGPQPWLVADPFGLQQAASWLRKPLQEIMPRNEGLARYIANAIGKKNTSELTAEQWLKSLENQIDLTMLADYSWSRNVPIIEGYLTSVLRKRKQLEGQEKPWQEDKNSLLIETHNLAESVFKWLLEKYSVDKKILPGREQDKNWTKEKAEIILRQYVDVQLSDRTIKKLASQKLWDIRNALVSGNSSLKALMFAALLSTVEYSNHPLKNMLPELLVLEKILDMSDARNKYAGHAGKDEITKEKAIEYADLIIAWVQNFKEWY